MALKKQNTSCVLSFLLPSVSLNVFSQEIYCMFFYPGDGCPLIYAVLVLRLISCDAPLSAVQTTA